MGLGVGFVDSSVSMRIRHFVHFWNSIKQIFQIISIVCGAYVLQSPKMTIKLLILPKINSHRIKLLLIIILGGVRSVYTRTQCVCWWTASNRFHDGIYSPLRNVWCWLTFASNGIPIKILIIDLNRLIKLWMVCSHIMFPNHVYQLFIDIKFFIRSTTQRKSSIMSNAHVLVSTLHQITSHFWPWWIKSVNAHTLFTRFFLVLLCIIQLISLVINIAQISVRKWPSIYDNYTLRYWIRSVTCTKRKR